MCKDLVTWYHTGQITQVLGLNVLQSYVWDAQLHSYTGSSRFARTSIRADLIALAREILPAILLRRKPGLIYLRACQRLSLHARDLCLTRLSRCVMSQRKGSGYRGSVRIQRTVAPNGL